MILRLMTSSRSLGLDCSATASDNSTLPKPDPTKAAKHEASEIVNEASNSNVDSAVVERGASTKHNLGLLERSLLMF
jgi:hypothetical protein